MGHTSTAGCTWFTWPESFSHCTFPSVCIGSKFGDVETHCCAIRLGTDPSYFQPKKWDVETQKKSHFRKDNAFQQQLASFLCQTWRLLAAVKTAGFLLLLGSSTPGLGRISFFKFSISRTVDRWSRKKIPERLHNWPKKKHSDFSDDLDAIKRTISAKRVSSKTLETPFDLSQKSRSKWKKWISWDPRRRHISPFAKTDPFWQSFELKYRKP